MTLDAHLEALELPVAAKVAKRIPKTLLQERAPTAADRRRVAEGTEELTWVAALKPTTIGVPAFRDGVREYLEVAILAAKLRVGAVAMRVAELVHRAIPYPVLLLTGSEGSVSVSVAHKRWSQNEMGATVLDGDLVLIEVDAPLAELAVTRQPRTDLFVLYEGWRGVLAPRVELARLGSEIARLRAAAAKERQMSRLVELNLAVQRLERERAAALGRL